MTRNTRTIAGCCAFLAASVVPSLLFHTDADALPLCGGNQNIQVAPITCTNSKTFTLGTAQRTITVILDVTASGALTVTYGLDAPVPVAIPIAVRAHVGISSSGDTPNEDVGVIPANTLTAVLSVQIKCGQIDTKAVFIANGDARGRVAAPYVTTADNCGTAPTTTTSSPTTVPSPSSTVPPPSSTTPGSSPPVESTSSVPITAPTVPGGGGTLPTTGNDYSAVAFGAGCLLLVGLALRGLTKRGKEA